MVLREKLSRGESYRGMYSRPVCRLSTGLVLQLVSKGQISDYSC